MDEYPVGGGKMGMDYWSLWRIDIEFEVFLKWMHMFRFYYLGITIRGCRALDSC